MASFSGSTLKLKDSNVFNMQRMNFNQPVQESTYEFLNIKKYKNSSNISKFI